MAKRTDVLVGVGPFQMNKDETTARLVRAIEHPALMPASVTPWRGVIGHRPPIDVDAVLRAAARAGIALEIHSFPERLDLDDELTCRA